jgi:cephalosporin-C deacetylase-like acetyl esterase
MNTTRHTRQGLTVISDRNTVTAISHVEGIMSQFAPEYCHESLMRQAPKSLAFHAGVDSAAWRQHVGDKLHELLGVSPERVPLEITVEYEREHETFIERRFTFVSEPGAMVPCHLLLPKNVKGPFPAMICLQGHSTGMHISLGRAKYDGDEASIAGGRDFALQAVAQGFAALTLEQRCFGERGDSRPKERRFHASGCAHATHVALLLGRTMIGERVWDISRAIDVLLTFSEVDPSRIACMGNSGGGTATYYAACMDERIAMAMPSCAVCTYAASIGSIDHCVDNYIPGALKYFDMQDLAGLIAPRPLIVVAGRQDNIFPLNGVEEAFTTIQQIYAAAGMPENCRLVLGEQGHQFYPEEAWPVFRDMMQRQSLRVVS